MLCSTRTHTHTQSSAVYTLTRLMALVMVDLTSRRPTCESSAEANGFVSCGQSTLVTHTDRYRTLTKQHPSVQTQHSIQHISPHEKRWSWNTTFFGLAGEDILAAVMPLAKSSNGLGSMTVGGAMMGTGTGEGVLSSVPGEQKQPTSINWGLGAWSINLLCTNSCYCIYMLLVTCAKSWEKVWYDYRGMLKA